MGPRLNAAQRQRLTGMAPAMGAGNLTFMGAAD